MIAYLRHPLTLPPAPLSASTSFTSTSMADDKTKIVVIEKDSFYFFESVHLKVRTVV